MYEGLSFELEIQSKIEQLRGAFDFTDQELKYLLGRNQMAFTQNCQPEVVRQVFVDELGHPF